MPVEKKNPERVSFKYQKARHHRTLHADGVWAGITPQLEIQVALFNDLKMMPDEVTHRVTPEGQVAGEIARRMPPEVLREVDVTVVMNKDVVKNVIELLTRMVSEVEKHIASRSDQPIKQDGEASKVT